MGYYRRQKIANRQAANLSLFDRSAELMGRRAEDSGFDSQDDLRAAIGVISDAKKIFTEYSPYESEIVVRGTFSPDRRLPNILQDLDGIILAQVRAKFLGKVAQESVEHLPVQSTQPEDLHIP